MARYGHLFPAELKNGANFLGLMLYIAFLKLGDEYTEDRGLGLVADALQLDAMAGIADGVWLPPGSQTTLEYATVMVADKTQRRRYRECMAAALGLTTSDWPALWHEGLTEADMSAWPPTLAMALEDDGLDDTP